MSIYSINPSNVDAVAKFMAAIKPDWWDFEGARQQLLEVSALAKLVGLIPNCYGENYHGIIMIMRMC